MARAKSGKSLISARKLLQVEGMDEILDNLSSLLDKTTAKQLKSLYVEASKPVWSQAKKNIQTLPISSSAKEVLDAMMMINKGQDRKQHALSGMSQAAGVKKLGRHSSGGKRFIPNPYWFEFGTSRGMGAHPFFRPAVAMVKSQVRQILVDGFRDILAEAEAAASAGKKPRGRWYGKP